jgi:predicted DNA-binding transcriptional regulator AlpA
MRVPLTQAYDQRQSEPAPLLRVADLQRVLACSRPTVYRLIREGALKPVYLDRRPRFEPKQVRELIESRRGRRGDD